MSFAVGHVLADGLVLHLGEHRIHHREEPDRDRHGHAGELHAIERRAEPRERSAEQQPERHRREDPDREEPVERRKLLDDRRPGHPGGHVLEQPQSGPQQDSFAVGSVRGAATFPGFVPRTNALMNLPSIMRRDRRDVESGAREKRGGVLRLVDARRLDGRILESRLREQRDELLLLERAGHAADPELHVLAHVIGNGAAHDDVGDREPPARLEHAERFLEHARACRPRGSRRSSR